PRGTASVVGLAAMCLRQRDPEAVMAVLTADHFIEDVNRFQDLLRAAAAVAGDGYLVTLGIEPAYAATGYGYIQRGEALGTYHAHVAHRVLRFKEKPDEATAQAMLREGDHDWNSGMFIWRVDRIWEAFEQLMPDLAEKLAEIERAWAGDQRAAVLNSVWHTIQPEAIDYGVMEKSHQTAVLSGYGLGWNDVGSWDSLFEVLETDCNGNLVLTADHLGLDTRRSLVCSEQPDRLIVTVGVEDLIIVDTGTALLVCSKGAAQRVRQVVEQLKQQGKEYYL
ncbi:MAG: sugar phosphate nucleotidyltransferase, partial [Anaerolineaceae bacterium]|nr:sugar phosphate nucleotidyltransferase [Anaerolineaceae bacterium]